MMVETSFFTFFLLLLLMDNATSLKCYNCLSEDDVSCMKSETLSACPREILKPACLTLSYSRVLKDGTRETRETTYQKKCVNNEYECSHWCERKKLTGADKCVGACCTSDSCNRSRNKAVVIGKRSSTVNASSMLQMDMLSPLVFISIFIHNMFQYLLVR